MRATTDPITAARAAALFVSDLSVTTDPSTVEVAAAIRLSLRTRGSARACAAEVAAAYGDYPELAARRMRWARDIVESRYGRQSPRRPERGGRVPGPIRRQLAPAA
jgi:hypothetical protein